MKISIITVNLNDGSGLECTLNSVRAQSYLNYELIVIDGKSVDSSLKVIDANKDIIWQIVSESDKGIFDAMNKGLHFSTGDFVVFLNSGDIFFSPDVLENVVNKISDKNKVYFGSSKVYFKEDLYYFFPKQNSTERDIKRFLSYYLPNHQSVFFPKVFYKDNMYDLQYKYASDVDYEARAINMCGYSFINECVAIFSLGGVSTPSSYKKMLTIFTEVIKIHKQNHMYSILKHFRLLKNLTVKCISFMILKGNYYRFLVNYKKDIK